MADIKPIVGGAGSSQFRQLQAGDYLVGNTPTTGDNSTKYATTAFVAAAISGGGSSKVTGTTITGSSNTLASGNLNTLVEYVGTTYGAGVYIPTGLGTHADIINILNAHPYSYDLYLYPQSGVTLYKGGSSVSSVIIKANTLVSIVRMSATNKWLVM